MARTSTPWSLLAKELGCSSATTCSRRLDEWARAGVFEQLQAVLLEELGEAGRIDLERVSVDSFSLRAVKRGDLTGANPSRSGKQGSKLHLAGERGGLPLSVVLSAANANDSTMLETLLEDTPAIRMPTGHRRRGPARCMPTRPTTILAARPICVGEGSSPARPPDDGVLGPAGPPPLDDRTNRGLAGRLPAATDPL